MSMEDLMRSPVFQQQAATAARGVQALGGAMIKLKKDTKRGLLRLTLLPGAVNYGAEQWKLSLKALRW